MGDAARARRDALECAICLGVLKAPVVVQCGCTFCKACLDVYVETRGAGKGRGLGQGRGGKNARVADGASASLPCPVCQMEIGDGVGYPNLALERLAGEREGAAAGGQGRGAGGRSSRSADVMAVAGAAPMLSVDVAALPEVQVNALLNQLLERKANDTARRTSIGAEVMLSFLDRCRKDKLTQLKDVQHDLGLVDTDLRSLGTIHTPLDELTVPSVDEESSETAMERLVLPDAQARNSLIARYYPNVKSLYFDRRRAGGVDALSNITETLVQATSFSSARRHRSIHHIDIMHNNHKLISSIEFNAPASLFATAGVTKRIKIYDFNSLLAPTAPVADPYPILEITVPSKLSCLSWNVDRVSMLAASTYKGDIIIHDTGTNTQLHALCEHTARAWHVDFSTQEPNLLVSGSDDKTVKMWDVERQSESALTLPTLANVCCVKFNPFVAHEVAFGSADHSVYSYDMRYPKSALCVFEGHWRAVSYVLFLNRSELVSASTDSSCKLWNVRKQEPGLSYGGHKNDRNFVGLSGSGDFFATGSEDNSVYVYHKALAGPVVRYGFGGRGGFVSTVAWKPKSNWLVAANNTGTVEVLELA